MTADADQDVARLRAAVSSTDTELDVADLRSRLAAQRTALARPEPTRRARHGIVVAVVVALAAVGVAGVAVFQKAALENRPVIGVPIGPAGQPTTTGSSPTSTAAGVVLAKRVDEALAGTRLTATMTTRTDSQPGGARHIATVIHAPQDQRVRAEHGGRVFLDLGHGNRQLLVDHTTRRAWMARPADHTLGAMIDLPTIDPLITLMAISPDHAVVQSPASADGRTTLRTYQDGTHLDCVIDDADHLPTTCRTYTDRRDATASTTTTFTWTQLTATQWKTVFSVDTPAGYDLIKVP